MNLVAVDGSQVNILGKVHLHEILFGGMNLGPVGAIVVERLPAGVDIIVGNDVILKRGLTIRVDGDDVCIKFGSNGAKLEAITAATGVKSGRHLQIKEDDFEAQFDGAHDGDLSMIIRLGEPHVSIMIFPMKIKSHFKMK